MSRYLVTISGPRSREEAHALVSKAPVGTRIEVKAAKRTDAQNDRMWAMLTEVALQVQWGGQRHTPDKWKLLFLDNLRRELAEEEELLPSLDGGGGMVNVGVSSSDLSRAEMTMLIELIFKFGDAHGVIFGDEARAA